MDALGPWHLLLILIGFVALFGYRKLPDASRAVGRSLRIFRSELRAADDDAPRQEGPSAEELERAAVAAEEEAAALRARAAGG